MRPGAIIPARDMNGTVVQYFRKRILWNTPLANVGIWVGTFPAGAFILPCWAKVITAFDGTTPIVTAGTDGSQQNIIGAADITEGTIGVYGPFNAGAALNFAVSTPLYVRAVIGGAPTAGEAIIVIPYISDDDQ